MKYLQQAIVGTSYKVNLMTHLTREQVALGLKRADIFVFPSTYEETWGLCLQEALASGCACIASNVAGAMAQIHEGMGILVPPRDPTAIREALDMLVENQIVRDAMGHNARAHVEKFHSLEAMGERFETIYKQVIDDNQTC
jgi:glycosyltransferase involved in cell wall biosynthesis